MRSHQKQSTARKRRLAQPNLVPVAPADASSVKEPEVNAVKDEAEDEPLEELICGTRNRHMARLFLSQMLSVMPAAADVSESELLDRVLPAVETIDPQDEIEGMLAVQMVAVHNVALNQLHRAAHADQYKVSGPAAADNAAKLLGVFLEQLQALQCYRAKAQQKVTMEHTDRE
jgi:hypothetical protein